MSEIIKALLGLLEYHFSDKEHKRWEFKLTFPLGKDPDKIKEHKKTVIKQIKNKK